jgi:hypothetical protein
VPLAALAADAGPTAKPAAKTAAVAAATPAAQSKSTLQASKARGSLMGACQKKAAEQDLQQIERKQFLSACMSGK